MADDIKYIIKVFESVVSEGEERSEGRKNMQRWMNRKAAETYELVSINCCLHQGSCTMYHTVTMQLKD